MVNSFSVAVIKILERSIIHGLEDDLVGKAIDRNLFKAMVDKVIFRYVRDSIDRIVQDLFDVIMAVGEKVKGFFKDQKVLMVLSQVDISDHQRAVLFAITRGEGVGDSEADEDLVLCLSHSMLDSSNVNGRDKVRVLVSGVDLVHVVDIGRLEPLV